MGVTGVKWFFLLPGVVWILLFTLFPLLYAVNMSLHAYRFGIQGAFIGLDNFRRLFTDNVLHDDLITTFQFVIIAVAIEMVLGIGLALVTSFLLLPIVAMAMATTVEIVDAMAELLEEREPADIAITELVARAGVSRPSFYQHAGDITTLVALTGVDRVARVFARSDARTAGLDSDDLARETVRNIVADLGAEREFYRRVLRGSHDVAARITDFVASRMRARRPLDDDLVTAISAGATWLIIRWLDDETPDTPDAMADRLLAVLLTLSTAAIRPAWL